MNTNKIVVGLMRIKTGSHIEIPQEVLRGVDYDDYLTMSQVIDEWIESGFEGFVVRKIVVKG